LFALLALLLAFLALLLAPFLLLTSAAGEPPYESLGLIRNPSDGILHALHRLPGLIGYLA
jgi:hypothetical protein